MISGLIISLVCALWIQFFTIKRIINNRKLDLTDFAAAAGLVVGVLMVVFGLALEK